MTATLNVATMAMGFGVARLFLLDMRRSVTISMESGILNGTLAIVIAMWLGYGRFGKGVGDPGVLDLGDCFSYGTAMALRQPLLFKGEDFGLTDVEVAGY